MRTTLDSRAIARHRGVGTVPLLTRDAPTIDRDLDLSTATGDQLEQQRTALMAAIGAGTADDATVQRAQAVAQAITAHNARVAAAESARQALLGGSVARSANAGVPGAGDDDETQTRGGGGGQPVARSLGEQFTAAQAFRNFATAPRGTTQITVPGNVRALLDTGSFPSQPTRVPGIRQPDRDQPLTLLDMVDRQSIDTNAVEWVQEAGYTDNAGTVAEGGIKPESTASFTLRQDTARVIAHWVKFTRQALADESMMQGYIAGRMTYGLLKKLNSQIASGDGVSPNMRGILATSGIGRHIAPAGEKALVSIRRARTIAELSGYSPDTVVVNPIDWERIELTSDTTGQFVIIANGAVAQGATPRLWGLAVVITTNVAGTSGTTGGTFLVGGFREGATLWERTGVEFYLTDSHAEDFTSNLITMLAELRAFLSVWAPKAFVHGTFAGEAV